jgi:two-component system response regulator AtoC
MGTRVLLVEDNEVFRRPLQRALEAAGYAVVAVSSGEDALASLDGSRIELVLTDQHLPRMGGIALVARIKARQPAVRVIVMTADATSESAIDAGRGGADDYLVKPFEMPELLRALHRALAPQKPPTRDARSEAP